MELRRAGRFSSLAWLITLAALLLPAPPMAAANYSVTLISDQMSMQAAGLKMNRNSHLVWEDMVSVGGYANYFLRLYRGGAKTAIPCDSNISHSFLDMNDRDEVVWTQEWYLNPSTHYTNVYLYSGGGSSNITDAASDHINHMAPRLNNLGTIIWYESGAAISRMALRNSASVISYANASVDGAYGTPRINNRDEVVWSGNLGSGNLQIYYWHNGAPTAITSDATDNKRPELNNRGDIVYAKVTPTGYDLYFYSGSADTHTKIGSGVDSHLLYAINDQSQVAWVNSSGQLYLHSGGSNIPVGPADWTQRPGLNNLGQVAYGGSFNYIWLYDQRYGSNVQLFSGGGKSVQINDSSRIAWFKGTGDLLHNSLYLASPNSAIVPLNFLLLGN